MNTNIKIMDKQQSIYKSEEARERCIKLYDLSLSQWKMPVEEIDVKTKYGTTHVIVSGKKDGLPVILLHGQWATATMWSFLVNKIGHKYRCYAIDQIDDIGKSRLERPINNRIDYGNWLKEAITKMNIEKSIIIGLSYGGFLAINLASLEPTMINKLVLLCPGIPLLGSPKINWALHGMPMLFIPNRITAEWLVKGLSILGYKKGNQEQEQLIEGGLSIRNRIPKRPIIEEKEFASIKMPILILIGEKETMYEPYAAKDRACLLFPNIEAEIIPKAGHMLSTDQPELVINRISKFIERNQ
jgi:pimeloyl-ACP methyl ester carboxylesterase